MGRKPRITLFSIACCTPGFEAIDREYVVRIQEALKKTGIEAEVEILPATNAFFGGRVQYISQVWPLLSKYGAAAAPALFVDKKLVLYGGVPTVEKLVEVLGSAEHKVDARP